MTTHRTETIIPLIKIQEKLEQCNAEETQLFCQEFKSKIMDQNIWDKIDIVKRLLCCIHSDLTADFFSQLLSLFPNDNDNISIHGSENQLFHITELPHDVLTYSCKFLNISDLYHLEQTCRLLCIISRNPSSLHTLTLEYKPYFGKFVNYQHTRYSKIRSLTLNRHNEDTDENDDDRFDYWTSLLPTFTNVIALTINNVNIHSIAAIPSSIRYGENIIELHLCHISILSVLNMVSKCSNIEQLDICELRHHDELEDENEITEIIANSAEYTWPDLKYFRIDVWSLQDSDAQNFVYLILANGLNHKIFTLMHHQDMLDPLEGFFDPNSDSDVFDIQRKAILNISSLRLGVWDLCTFNNFAQWIAIDKNIKFDTLLIDLMNISTRDQSFTYSFKPLHVILSVSKTAKIYWSNKYQIIPPTMHYPYRLDRTYNAGRVVNMMPDWPLQILNKKLPYYKGCEMKIKCCIKVKIFDTATSNLLQLLGQKRVDESSHIFRDNIQYWLELKSSNIIKLEYDVVFEHRSDEIVKWSRQIEKIQTKCAPYPISVEITQFHDRFRVRF